MAGGQSRVCAVRLIHIGEAGSTIIMIEIKQIQALSQQIVEQFQPDRIILFGSYAYGTPNEDSDVDLMVVMPFEGHPVNQAIKVLNHIHAEFPLDLLVRTDEFITERLKLGDFFMMDIVETGRILYEAADTRMV